MDLIKIEPDKERANNLIKLTELRIRKIKHFDRKEECALLVESYYEIIKELITAILFIKGYKTLSHKDLVEYLRKEYKNTFQEYEIEIIDSLRIRRNKLVYEGIFTDPNYVERNQEDFDEIIAKLKKVLNETKKPN